MEFTYEQGMLLFWIFLCICVFFLIVSGWLFIYFKIPKLVGDLSGKNKKRAIANIQKSSRDTVNPSLRPQNTGERTSFSDAPQLSDNSFKIHTQESTMPLTDTDETAMLNNTEGVLQTIAEEITFINTDECII